MTLGCVSIQFPLRLRLVDLAFPLPRPVTRIIPFDTPSSSSLSLHHRVGWRCFSIHFLFDSATFVGVWSAGIPLLESVISFARSM